MLIFVIIIEIVNRWNSIILQHELKSLLKYNIIQRYIAYLDMSIIITASTIFGYHVTFEENIHFNKY